MKPLRKSFAGDPLFPFEIVYKTIKKQDNELPDHLHDLYELVYVHQGKGIFFIDQTWYEKHAGDLFFIPGNTIHHSLPDDADPIVSSAIFFAPSLLGGLQLDHTYNPLQCFELARKNKIYKLAVPKEIRQTIELGLEEIADEFSSQMLGCHDAVWLVFSQILLLINRLVHSSSILQTVNSHFGPPWILEALETINSHPERAVSLIQLAEQARVSPAHFSRVFKQLTTMNVTAYVNAKRIIKAKELLIDSSNNINDIAEQCGFETATHFYRVFKSLTSMTPGQYRSDR